MGHKYGGILIKSLIIEVNKVAHRKTFEDVAEKEAKDSCEAFQHNLGGIMFYSVPHFMTKKDIQIMFQGDSDNYEERKFSRSDSPNSIYHKSSAWQAASSSANPPQNTYRKLSALQALSHQIEATNEDFKDSIAHDHTKICVIANGLTKKMKVNSSTFMLHHVLDDGHINIFCSRSPIWKKLIKSSS